MHLSVAIIASEGGRKSMRLWVRVDTSIMYPLTSGALKVQHLHCKARFVLVYARIPTFAMQHEVYNILVYPQSGQDNELGVESNSEEGLQSPPVDRPDQPDNYRFSAPLRMEGFRFVRS
jgi:hypothetical protein